MKRRKSNEYKQVWATPKFRKFLYGKKAENPDKTLFEIQNEIADSFKEQTLKQNEKKPKKETFFPKW